MKKKAKKIKKNKYTLDDKDKNQYNIKILEIIMQTLVKEK